MKANCFSSGPAPLRDRVSARNAQIYRTAILAVSLTCGRGAAVAQTTNAPAATPGGGGSTNVIKLAPTTVVGKLDVARNQIVPDLGATTYTLDKEQIAAQPGGENAPFNQVLLRTPGMAQDSAANGDLHLRGEHANLQYRINDVLLPEGISGFGQELDTRFVDSLRLITGSLPAQYGFRTAGVVDLRTKSGAFEPGGEASLYGGSYDTIKPGLELGGSKGNLNFFADSSFNHTGIGIENPTPSKIPLHDYSDQFKAFTYLSYVLDDTSRISVMGSGSYSTFEVPNTPGNTTPAFPGAPGQPATFDSANLNENQLEANYYGVVAYQKSAGDFNMQVATFGRSSSVHFKPDNQGDLFLNGSASDVDRTIYSGGLQLDASYQLGDKHTLRGGVMVLAESLSAHSTTTAFNLDPITGAPTAVTNITDNSVQHAWFGGIYIQDEWKILPKVTLNYGARFDIYYASADHENQPSPRVNLIYQPTDATTLHAGYARYFTPPPLENVPTTSVQKFDGTSNAAGTDQSDPVKAERANYFDAGVSQKLAPGLQIGVDGYYKTARQQLDDGLFNNTLILSAFNYAKGEVYGAELTATYTKDGFSTYVNFAFSHAQGFALDSAQFLFPADKLNYTQNNWIFLDHDQRFTGSVGASYLWRHTCGSTRFYVDAIYGSGLRQDGGGTVDGTATGAPIPNGATVPSYYSLNLGLEEAIKIHGKEHLKVRFDVVNVTDHIYQLRSGSGIGVFAPQYGMRLGFFGGLTYVF
ncbi:MAG TPA: TonB-dependent receptor [Candidatus Binatia bacterium]|jgi:outer membrane receptor protein involved in Fe transport|nr:TonB-dependent receptor [Candidatus Binatia bacterium]